MRIFKGGYRGYDDQAAKGTARVRTAREVERRPGKAPREAQGVVFDARRPGARRVGKGRDLLTARLETEWKGGMRQRGAAERAARQTAPRYEVHDDAKFAVAMERTFYGPRRQS